MRPQMSNGRVVTSRKVGSQLLSQRFREIFEQTQPQGDGGGACTRPVHKLREKQRPARPGPK